MKNLKKLGVSLSKQEQQKINGGACTDAGKISCLADGGIWVNPIGPDCFGFCLCEEHLDEILDKL